jgi:uncharacterized protein YfiM (DUF2279 family)
MNSCTILLLALGWAPDAPAAVPRAGAPAAVTARAPGAMRGPFRLPAVCPGAAAGPAVLPRDADGPPAPDPWLAEDKLRHFFTSLAAANMAYGGARLVSMERRPALLAAGAAAGAAGLLKEVRDRRRGGRFSYRDLAWDAAGIAVGLAVVAQVR